MVRFLTSHPDCTSDGCLTVTNEEGIFNIELKKSSFLESNPYKSVLYIGHYKIEDVLTGEKMKKDSIYHFRILKQEKEDGAYDISIESIHNDFFF